MRKIIPLIIISLIIFIILLFDFQCLERKKLDTVEAMMDIATMPQNEIEYLMTTLVGCNDKDVNKSVVGCIIKLKIYVEKFARNRNIDKYIKKMIKIKGKELSELKKEKVDEAKIGGTFLASFIMNKYLYEVLRSYSTNNSVNLSQAQHKEKIQSIVIEVESILRRGKLIK